jgi:5-methylcytosine-specific restriction endonuclease McrA
MPPKLQRFFARFFDALDEVTHTPRPCPRCGRDKTFAESYKANNLVPLLTQRTDEFLSMLTLCPACFEVYREELAEQQLREEEPTEPTRVRRHLQRAIEHGCPATLTVTEWLDTLNQFNWRCAYCGGVYEALEHILPITLGGGTTKENCVPACWVCNVIKSGRHPDVLIALGQGLARHWKPALSPAPS